MVSMRRVKTPVGLVLGFPLAPPLPE